MKTQDRIDFLLDELDRVYPEERKAAIRARMQAFWNGQMPRDRLPWAALEYGEPCTDFPEDATMEERDLIGRLHNLIQHGTRWNDDHYPALSMDIRQSNLPSYFGCVEEHASKSVRVKPMIHDPEDVYRLRENHFEPGTFGRDALNTLSVWRKLTHGRVSFFEPDMQGPFSTASQVWGVEPFLLATCENPDEVHYLVDRCCDAALEFCRLMTEAVEGDILRFHCMPCLWYPIEKGMAVSEDLATVVSASSVQEYMTEPLARIARETGGVCVHACGSLNHAAGVLSHVPGMMALNCSTSESNLPDLMEKKEKSVRMVVHNALLTSRRQPLLNPLQHACQVGEQARAHGEPIFAMFLNFDGTVLPDMQEKYADALRV